MQENQVGLQEACASCEMRLNRKGNNEILKARKSNFESENEKPAKTLEFENPSFINNIYKNPEISKSENTCENSDSAFLHKNSRIP